MISRRFAVAVCCSSNSSRSRVSRPIVVSDCAAGGRRGAFWRLGDACLRRRGLTGSPPVLERRFIVLPVPARYRIRPSRQTERAQKAPLDPEVDLVRTTSDLCKRKPQARCLGFWLPHMGDPRRGSGVSGGWGPPRRVNDCQCTGKISGLHCTFVDSGCLRDNKFDTFVYAGCLGAVAVASALTVTAVRALAYECSSAI